MVGPEVHENNSIVFLDVSIDGEKAVTQFMVQGGDTVKGDGTSGESIYGPTFEDENFKLTHDAGVLSMANRGRPHTNGSQFCITTQQCLHLDGTNVVFGRVLSGLGVATEMQQCTGSDCRLTLECFIENCGEVTGDWRDWIRDEEDNLPEYPEDHPDLDKLTIEQLLGYVSSIKRFGNSYFGAGRYKTAVRKYEKSLRYIARLMQMFEEAPSPEPLMPSFETAVVYTQQCNLNLAACHVKLEEYVACIKCCTEVLEVDGCNEKALYRRAQAHFALKSYEAALSDLRRADRLRPHNRAVLELLQQVRTENKNYNQTQKERLAKFFRDQKAKGLPVGHN